jgi:hypothetical protein
MAASACSGVASTCSKKRRNIPLGTSAAMNASELTLIPSAASSMPADFVSASTPPFDVP